MKLLQLISMCLIASQALLALPAKAVNVLDQCLNGECSFAPVYPSTNGLTNVPLRISNVGFADFNQEEFIDLINQQVIAPMNGLEESTVNIINDGFIPENQDDDNFLDIFNNSSFARQLPAVGSSFGYSFFVVDQDGSIIDGFFGEESTILGVATAMNYDEDETFEGLVIVDPNNFSSAFSSDTKEQRAKRLIRLAIHELGHMLGLAHLQSSHLEEARILGAAPRANIDSNIIPLMYPFIVSPPDGETTIHRDDKSSLGFLYPSQEFQSTTGTIEGSVSFDGVPFLHANVIAYKVDDLNNETVSSTTEGYSSFSLNNSDSGEFKLVGLSPGNYIIKVEPEFFDDLGPIGQIPSSGPYGFYRGEGRALLATNNIRRARRRALKIRVGAGETISGINMSATKSFNFFLLVGATVFQQAGRPGFTDATFSFIDDPAANLPESVSLRVLRPRFFNRLIRFNNKINFNHRTEGGAGFVNVDKRMRFAADEKFKRRTGDEGINIFIPFTIIDPVNGSANLESGFFLSDPNVFLLSK